MIIQNDSSNSYHPTRFIQYNSSNLIHPTHIIQCASSNTIQSTNIIQHTTIIIIQPSFIHFIPLETPHSISFIHQVSSSSIYSTLLHPMCFIQPASKIQSVFRSSMWEGMWCLTSFQSLYIFFAKLNHWQIQKKIWMKNVVFI